jgi:hypothetical protein
MLSEVTVPPMQCNYATAAIPAAKLELDIAIIYGYRS